MNAPQRRLDHPLRKGKPLWNSIGTVAGCCFMLLSAGGKIEAYCNLCEGGWFMDSAAAPSPQDGDNASQEN